MVKRNNRRRGIIVDKKIQMRYLVLPILGVLINSVFFLGILLYLMGLVSSNVDSMGSSLYFTIVVFSLTVVVANLSIVVYLGLVASNHFIGPLYRLKKSIDGLVKGSYGQKISFRENDLKFRLAQVYNELSSTLEERVEEDLVFIDSIKRRVRNASAGLKGDVANQLKEMDMELDSFRKTKTQYIGE